MAKKHRKLGEILYRKQLVSKENLIKALKKAKADNKRLGETCVEMGLTKQKIIDQVLAKQFGLKYYNLDDQEVPEDAVKLIPFDLIKKHSILPLEMNNGKLKIIITDPNDFETLDMLRFRFNADLECYYANPDKLAEFINNLNGGTGEQGTDGAEGDSASFGDDEGG